MAETLNRIPPIDVTVTPKQLRRSSLKWNISKCDLRKLVKCIPRGFQSPVSRLSGRNKRAEDLGWTGWKNSSFEGNQSFPRFTRSRYQVHDLDPITSPTVLRMERIRGDGLNTCSFSAGRARGSFSLSKFPDVNVIKASQPTTEPSSNIKPLQGISDSAWSFSSSFISAVGGSTSSYQITTMNPNKAVFTIDMKTSQILVVNGMASSILGLTSDELCQMKLSQLLNEKHKTQITAFAEGELDPKDGNMVVLSGKVVEMLTKDGRIVPVSLWLRKLEAEGRCLAVAEPVERRVAQLIIDNVGCIVSADSEAAVIFQFDEEELLRDNIVALIPAIKLPGNDESLTKDVRKQKATGRTHEGSTFPLCLWISDYTGDDIDFENDNSTHYTVTICVFANMSGLVVLTDDGNIECCNHHFTHMMFGYPQSELIGQKITSIIPNFCEDLEYLGDSLGLPHLDLNKGEEENDNSNYDSAKDYMETEKSRSSSVIIESEVSLKTKPSADTFKSGCTQDTINVKDVVNGNHSGVGEIIDSFNRLNLDLSNSSSSSKKRSSFTLVQTATVESSHDDHEISVRSNAVHVLPPSTLCLQDPNNLLEGDCGDNGDLTPIVSPHLEFFEDDDHFETASDDYDSIEVLPSESKNNMSDLSSSIRSEIEESLISSNKIGSLINDSVEVNSSIVENSITEVDLNCSSDLLLTSTPTGSKLKFKKTRSKEMATKLDLIDKKFIDGSYIGFGRHKDGSNLDIVYQVHAVQLAGGRTVYCVWISRDPEERGEGGRNCGNLTLTSSFNSTVDNSLGQAIRSYAQSNAPITGGRSGSVSVLSQCEDDQIAGEYAEQYTTLQQIGKGAFGYVKMAFRNDDGLMVITKFIQKHKVHQQSWVDDPLLGKKVPLEISLLTTLKHPNIVQVLDVFENAKFFQLVMEKHGAGMDLFEFIDRKPYLDEGLNSYIFRQIVSAVDYLHSHQILHRDIKDENVIINERFHAKLIDFGSATFMSEGRLFSTFYGTVEYCSPEVLAGNKYEGPELEMWSLGVTLYVMTFGENPFFDVEETMKAELHPPCKVSEELMSLLHWMLDRDPRKRCEVADLIAHSWINQEIDISAYSFQDVVSCHPHEAHPPIYYTDYRDSANNSLSNCLPGTDSSSALLSHNDEGSNVDDRTVGSSNSLGSLTTVENFETEEELAALKDVQLDKSYESHIQVHENWQIPRTSANLGKYTHSMEEELVDLTALSLNERGELPEIESEEGKIVECQDDDDVWDADYYYEDDSFS